MTEQVRILHVDDDPAFADLAATVLERERAAFSVDTATQGTAGLDRLANAEYDCVVSDYDMPGLSGIEFLEGVRAEYPDLPFILFTGKGSEEVASEAISAGVTDYLQKGSASEQYALLANRIENAVSATRTAERAALQEDLMRHAELVGETGGWELDAVTGELYCTEGMRHILGVDEGDEPTSLEEFVGFYHPDGRPELRETIERGRAAGEQAAGEWRLQTADDDQRLVEVTVHPVEEAGEVVSLRGAIHDITERRERKRQLREERAFIEQALNALDDLFYVVEPDGRLRRYNDRVQEVTGYSDDHLAEMDVTAFVAEPDRERLAGAVEEALRAGRATVAAELRTADGDRLPYEFTGSRLTDSDGEPAGIVGVGRRRDDGGYPDPAGTLVEHAPDPAVLVDVTNSTTFSIEHVNPAYEDLTGLSADQVCGNRPGAVFGGAFGERIEAQYRNCIEQQRPVEYTEHWPVDGDNHEWETKLAPVLRNETVVALVGVKRDVTAYRQRETDLEHYEHLVENLPTGVFRVTPDGEFVSMNEALVSLCDAGSKATLRTAGVEALYAEPSHPGLLLEQLEERETVENKLVRIETLDGEQLWVELSLGMTDENGDRYIDGVVREVTEHGRPADTGASVTTQISREQRLERYEQFIETMDDIAVLVDTDWTVDYINETVTEYVDGPREEFCEQPVMQLFDRVVAESGRDSVERALAAAFDADREDPSALELESTGSAVFEARFSPLVENGQVRAVAVTLRDVTECERRADELARKNERLDEFASILSHDLRNPLSAAVGYLELAAEESDSAYLDDIERAHERMETLIETLLTLAREGETVQSPEPVDLRSVSERCWQTVGTGAATVDVETDCVVYADPSRLQQLFENLYRNAIEHAGEDVTVTVGELDGGFYVEDDGPGIAESERDQVFEMGYSSVTDSTGFGLSIVRRVAEAHGWDIRVVDGETGGARFEITGIDTPAPEP